MLRRESALFPLSAEACLRRRRELLLIRICRGQDLPAKRLRPEAGQAGQIVSVNDDVVESDRHAGSMRGTMDSILRTRTLLPLLAWPSR